jgi:hypothetical protein
MLYIKRNMRKLLIILVGLCSTSSVYSQSSTCEDATPFCTLSGASVKVSTIYDWQH